MGIYRRKNKAGKCYGPFIVQYPYKRDHANGSIVYKTETVGYKKREANDFLAEKMLEWKKKKDLGFEAREDVSFAELVEWYLSLQTTKNLKSYKKIMEHCQTLKEHFGEILAKKIRPFMVENYQLERLEQKTMKGTNYRPASVNREFEVLKRIFNLAVREEIVDRNPCWKVKKLPEENERDRILSQEEFRKLVNVLPSHAADMVRMGYYTGMRYGEISGLTWDRVNLEEGCIALEAEDTKTGKPRKNYLVNHAIDVLRRASKVRSISSNHVFTYQGRPIKSINTSLKTALRETGIKDFTFHDLRHTYNTNMRRAGVMDVVTMKMTGHRTLAMYTRYSTVDEKDGRDAATKLARLLDGEEEYTAKSTAISTATKK
jgi:integrase